MFNMNQAAINPDILGGKPVIKGTRVPVALIVEEIAGGQTVEDLMREYELTKEQVFGALRYAAAVLKDELVFS